MNGRALAKREAHDYLPFGEEIGGRTTTQGYTGDSVRQHFTGYEADAETGLNFAQARYQSPTQGRFTSVDPMGASAGVTNPQSFNRYSYVENNPVNATDPTGMMLISSSMTPNSAIGVEQTTDPEYVWTLQRYSDAQFQHEVNDAYAQEHGIAISQTQTGDTNSGNFTTQNTVAAANPQNPVTAAGEPPRTGEVVAQMNVVSAQQVREFNGSTCVGKSCDCVPLVKALTDTTEVHTSRWREGEAALGNASLPYGTPIATFIDGRYPSLPTGNHGAFLLGQVPRSREHPSGGILVLDQYPARGRIGIRVIENREGRGSRSNDASRFSVIWIAPPP